MRRNNDTGRLQINEEDVDAEARPKEFLDTANAWGRDGWELVNTDNGAWFFRRAKGAQGGSLSQGRQRPY
ncbi:MAG: hypothetical protein ACRDHX_13670 [Chloroflexota bacterium]